MSVQLPYASPTHRSAERPWTCVRKTNRARGRHTGVLDQSHSALCVYCSTRDLSSVLEEHSVFAWQQHELCVMG
jgi:hypothetical protein